MIIGLVSITAFVALFIYSETKPEKTVGDSKEDKESERER